MRTTTAEIAERTQLRWRPDDRGYPRGSARRRELAAGLATAVVAGQLVFAPVTLLSAATLVGIGRAARWRPPWLAVPTVATVVWLSTIGPAGAVAGFAAGSQRVSGYLLAAAIHPRLVMHAAVGAGLGKWLPVSLPLALLAGCGEAWLVLWLGWWRRGARLRSQWQWRPGLVAAARRRISAAALAAGQTVTRDGCAVGVATATGKLAGFAWDEALHGVLLAGAHTDLLGLSITCAALRRRKTVVVLDCVDPAATAGRGAVTARVLALARSLGVPVNDACPSAAVGIGRAIRRRETVLIDLPTADAASRAAAELRMVLSELRDLGLRADCLAWLNGFGSIDPASLRELVSLGQCTGTVIVTCATSSGPVANLAPAVAVVAAGYGVGGDVRLSLAGATTNCRAVPIRLDRRR